MSVDKFGRYTHKGKALRGPKGRGFKLTNDGNYDMQNKKLCFVGEPTEFTDAVNLKSLQKEGLELFEKLKSISIVKSKPGNTVDAHGYVISNVGDPRSDNDAVTKRYLHSNTPLKLEDSYLFGKKRLHDVGSPKDDGDAPNIKYLKDNYATRVYVNSRVPGHDKNSWKFQNRRLTGVGDPVDISDALTRNYFEQHTPAHGESSWGFSNKTLTDIADPVGIRDAVTRNYFEQHTPVSGVDSWRFSHKRLTGVADPVGMDDAVTVNYLVRVLGEMFYDSYRMYHAGEIVIDKASWIGTNIVGRYFIDPKTKLLK